MKDARRRCTPARDLWIFGYGSLMWRPGFAYVRRAHARLDGFHRGFRLYSMHHRGSIDRPGLVLGLDRGGTCEGMAYLIAPELAHATHAYLTEREQVSGAYREAWLPVTLLAEPHEHVMALAYLVERRHPNYAGRLTVGEQAHLIRGARGVSGNNLDYLLNTLAHLSALGIREPELARVAAIAGPHFAAADPGIERRPGVESLRCQVRRLPFTAPRLKPWQRKRFLHRRRMAAVAI